MRRLRVGVVGCGLIAQVMHLPHLQELDDRFEITALCDISPATLTAVADKYGVTHRFTRWQDLVADDLDAVLVLTTGSNHALPTIAAAKAGRHVFVEKPMCFTLREADAMIAAAGQSGIVLMVGNMKRFDPAYQRARPLVQAMRGLRLVRITTLEAPLLPYVAHHSLKRYADLPVKMLNSLRADQDALVREALGPDIPETIRRVYADVLLDSLVHEVNMLRGLLGEPEEVTSAETWLDGEGLTAVLGYPGDVRCVLTWVNLPELRHYSQELAFYAPTDRVTLRFPSPFLRNEPTELLVENMDMGAVREERIIVSYEEAFKLELLHFHACLVQDQAVQTSAADARQDLVVLQAIARAAAGAGPQRGLGAQVGTTQ
ncbi:MAG TPA: Gfo/Idh/MocA family oxidoreductase [Chloroflexota bacterium]|nr:Gfo/Idh/MocA family oxidoreductase [Chloroflexota bacterium]